MNRRQFVSTATAAPAFVSGRARGNRRKYDLIIKGGRVTSRRLDAIRAMVIAHGPTPPKPSARGKLVVPGSICTPLRRASRGARAVPGRQGSCMLDRFGDRARP